MNASTIRLPSYDHVPFDYGVLAHDVAQKAQETAERIRDWRRSAIVEIGRELNAIKDSLPHGQFGPWIEAEFGWSNSTAQNYMLVAKNIGDKFPMVANLPPTIIYRLAAPSTPPAVRDRVLQIEPGKSVLPNTVLQLINEARERQKKAERRQTKEPTPEEQAKALRRDKREAREQAKFDALRAAEKRAATEAAAAVRDALGDNLAAIQEMVRGLQNEREFLRALLEPVLTPDAESQEEPAA